MRELLAHHSRRVQCLAALPLTWSYVSANIIGHTNRDVPVYSAWKSSTHLKELFQTIYNHALFTSGGQLRLSIPTLPSWDITHGKTQDWALVHCGCMCVYMCLSAKMLVFFQYKYLGLARHLFAVFPRYACLLFSISLFMYLSINCRVLGLISTTWYSSARLGSTRLYPTFGTR